MAARFFQSVATPLVILLLLCLGTATSPGEALAAEPPEVVTTWVSEHLDDLIMLYREFHSHPELSFQEKETAERFAKELRAAGTEVTTGIGKHGVVGLLRNGEGPVLLLRTDLDALPVVEQTELAFSSKIHTKDKNGVDVGVMHACGHDVHITNLIGVTQFLAEHKKLWKGTVFVIGQPAEEIVAGAKAMLDDGLFTRFPKPDFGVALHVDAQLPAGKLAYRSGYSLANTDSVDITVRGKGGHGAYPHTTIDPIVLAAQLVLAFQTIVSREIKPTEPAVITVGSIHAGTKHNIIPDECRLQLTVRSYSDDVRKQLLDAIRRRAKGLAIAANASEPEIEVTEGTPALFNDENLTERVGSIFERVIGKENLESAEPSMGGEDFSQYGRAGVPVVMYRLGSVEDKRLNRYKELGQEPPSLHSALYYPDIEPTLTTGLISMSSVVLELLAP